MISLVFDYEWSLSGGLAGAGLVLLAVVVELLVRDHRRKPPTSGVV